jgi:DNA-binding MarR family transcriptional regulator
MFTNMPFITTIEILERNFRKERGFFSIVLGQMRKFSWVPFLVMESWQLLTKHGRVLVCIARDPRIRLREIAEALDITERSAYALVGDLVTAGYIVKQRDGRRNRYVIQRNLPLPGPATAERTIGELLELLLPAHPRGA